MVSKDCLFFRNSKTAGYKKKLMLQNNNSNNNNFICEDDAFGLSANKQFDDDDGEAGKKCFNCSRKVIKTDNDFLSLRVYSMINGRQPIANRAIFQTLSLNFSF